MPTLIPFDDDLIDTIQEFRSSNKPLASEPGLIDRVLSAVYHGLDVSGTTQTDEDGPLSRGQLRQLANQVNRGKSGRCALCGHATGHYDTCAGAVVSTEYKCPACYAHDSRYEHTCGVY